MTPAKSGPGSDAATRARLLAEARAELAERKRARGGKTRQLS